MLLTKNFVHSVALPVTIPENEFTTSNAFTVDQFDVVYFAENGYTFFKSYKFAEVE